MGWLKVKALRGAFVRISEILPEGEPVREWTWAVQLLTLIP